MTTRLCALAVALLVLTVGGGCERASDPPRHDVTEARLTVAEYICDTAPIVYRYVLPGAKKV